MCDALSGAHLVTTDIYGILYRLQSGGKKNGTPKCDVYLVQFMCGHSTIFRAIMQEKIGKFKKTFFLGRVVFHSLSLGSLSVMS